MKKRGNSEKIEIGSGVDANSQIEAIDPP